MRAKLVTPAAAVFMPGTSGVGVALFMLRHPYSLSCSISSPADTMQQVVVQAGLCRSPALVVGATALQDAPRRRSNSVAH